MESWLVWSSIGFIVLSSLPLYPAIGDRRPPGQPGDGNKKGREACTAKPLKQLVSFFYRFQEQLETFPGNNKGVYFLPLGKR